LRKVCASSGYLLFAKDHRDIGVKSESFLRVRELQMVSLRRSWQIYKWRIIAAFVLFAAQALMIGGLLIRWRRRALRAVLGNQPVLLIRYAAPSKSRFQ
jgi:hypothetical protein